MLSTSVSRPFSVLWEGKYTYLVSDRGFLAAMIKRNVSIGELSNEEKIEFEQTVGKMELVFKNALGFGDFVRWMPLGSERAASYLFPAAGVSDGKSVDLEYKARLMFYTLNDKKTCLLPLNDETVNAVAAAAKEVLPFEQAPVAFEEVSYPLIKMHEAFQLIQNKLKAQGHPCDVEFKETEGRKASLTDVCGAFCKKDVLERQHIAQTPFNRVLSHPLPYVEQHMMVVPHRHISKISENSNEEILDKYRLFTRIDFVVRNRFACPQAAVITRVGPGSGQTQSHLHDHVVGYYSTAIHPWTVNWLHEVAGLPSSSSLNDGQLAAIRDLWEPFFKSIKAVAFDLGGVVLEQKNEERSFFTEEFNLQGDQLEQLLEEFKRLTNGEMAEEKFWTEAAKKLNLTLKEGFQERWEACYIASNPIETKTLDLINRLKDQGVKTPLLSNTVESHARINEERGVLQHFSPLILSNVIKASKPSADAYNVLIEKTGIDPAEMVFIDDLPENVDGANKAGIHGLLFKNPEQAEREIHKLLVSSTNL